MHRNFEIFPIFVLFSVESDMCQKRLLDDLFDEARTDGDIRPIVEPDQPLNVSMDGTLFQILELVY